MNAFARAQAGYDDKHEKAPVEAVIRAVVEVSLISEPPVLVLRTGELTSTLVSVLAASLALSPSAARSPAAIRKVTDTLRRRLLKRVAAARADPDFSDFEARAFRPDDAKRGERL
jgi:hypothetical protein